MGRKVLKWFGHVKRIELLITRNVRVGLGVEVRPCPGWLDGLKKALVRSLELRHANIKCSASVECDKMKRNTKT